MIRHYRDDVLPKRDLYVLGAPVAGFIALDRAAPFVTALYTRAPGQGIGKRLLDFAKAGRDLLQLWTFQANTGARAFYAREGFVEERRTQGDNEEGLPDLLLRWLR